MKNLLRVTLVLALCFGGLSTVSAQNYGSAVGLRLGIPASVSYKTFIGGGSNAIEVFASYRKRNFLSSAYSWTQFGVSAGYQIHNDIESVDGLMWYYGAGAGVYFFNYSDVSYFGDAGGTSIGILGFLGLEYTFDSVPISISADWVPGWFIGGYGAGAGAGSGALAVRYILK
jgi:hypothetical protein